MNTVPEEQSTTVELPPIYKFLHADGRAPTGTGRYTKGRWRSVRGVLVPCRCGLHATTADNLVPHINETLWRVEIDGEYVWHDDLLMGRKLVARRMLTVERIEAWNDRTTRLFAVECAERVLPLFERDRPGDSRPREALAVARRFADGQATREELAAAGAAAGAAARDAAWTAAGAAAGTAAWAAASDAAWDAAWDAARAAASDTAWAAERRWQNERLAEMLGLAVAS